MGREIGLLIEVKGMLLDWKYRRRRPTKGRWSKTRRKLKLLPKSCSLLLHPLCSPAGPLSSQSDYSSPSPSPSKQDLTRSKGDGGGDLTSKGGRSGKKTSKKVVRREGTS